MVKFYTSFYTQRLMGAFVGVLVLTGCAAPATHGLINANIQTEVASVNTHLSCAWEAFPDPMHPVKGADYACVNDQFSSVILFLDPSDTVLDQNAPALEKMTLIWKAWHPGAHVVSGKEEASRAIAYVAQRFFPPGMALPLVETFFGQKNKHLSYKNLKVSYQFEKGVLHDLHQMDIYNKDPHLRLFAFPPPHQVPASQPHNKTMKE